MNQAATLNGKEDDDWDFDSSPPTPNNQDSPIQQSSNGDNFLPHLLEDFSFDSFSVSFIHL